MSESLDDRKLRVFISYSRDDCTLADELVSGLDLAGFEVMIDRHSIVEGEDWKTRLGALIADADTIVFMLSPSSAVSPMCEWEIERANGLSKRIIPVLARSMSGASAPSVLAALNYVRFDEGRSFMDGLKGLIRAPNADLEWLREHTRLLARAMEWSRGAKAEARLLSGADIAAAKEWAARCPKDAPEPTSLHLEFITASEVWADQQRSEERQRLQKMAEVQAARETALKDKEAAQQREAEQSLRVVKRTRIGLAVALVLAALAGTAGTYALFQEQEARRQAQSARTAQTSAEASAAAALEAQGITEKALAEADARREEALQSRTTLLREAATRQIDQGDPDLAALVILEATEPASTPRSRPMDQGLVDTLEAAVSTTKLVAHFPVGAKQITIDPRGRRVVVNTPGRLGGIYDIDSWQPLGTFGGLTQEWQTAELSADGTMMALGTSEGTVRLLEMPFGEELRRLRASDESDVTSVRFAAEGRIFTIGAKTGTVKLWDARTGDLIREWPRTHASRGNNLAVLAITISPDRNLLLTGGFDGLVNAFDAVKADHVGYEQDVIGGGLVTGLAISPDGSKVAVSGDGPRVRVLTLPLVDPIAWMDGKRWIPLEHVAWDPAGERVVAAASGGVVVWDAKSGEEVGFLRGQSGRLSAVVPLPGGQQFATATNGSGAVHIWDAATYELQGVLKNGDAPVLSAGVAPDGIFIAGTADGFSAWRLGVKNPSSGARLPVTLNVNPFELGGSFSFHFPSRRLAAVIKDTEAAAVWNLDQGGKPVAVLQEHLGPVQDIDFSPDGQFLLSRDAAGMVTLWDMTTYKKIRAFKGPNYRMDHAGFGPGPSRVWGAYRDGTLRVWDIETAENVLTMSGKEAYAEGTLSADQAYFAADNPGGDILLWDATTGKLLKKMATPESRVRSLVFHPDSGSIAASLQSGLILIFSVPDGRELHRFEDHNGRTHLAFSSDGRRLVSRDDNREVIVRRTDTYERISTFSLSASPNYVYIGAIAVFW